MEVAGRRDRDHAWHRKPARGRARRRRRLRFERRSCGAGVKGPRSYDWALAEVTWPGGADGGPRRGCIHLLLVRRSITDPTQIAYFAVHARSSTPIGEIVRVTGLRWSIEDCFETAKSDCGLDHYEVRTWDAWHVTSPCPWPPSPS
ncbi:hypothetical protein [Streptomyces sp. NPDC001774]